MRPPRLPFPHSVHFPAVLGLCLCLATPTFCHAETTPVLASKSAPGSANAVVPIAPGMTGSGLQANLRGSARMTRSLHYRPDGLGFAVHNGHASFNRPLYGSGTAFRIDAGDQPLFGLYLPGRGGVLRLGWTNATGDSCWAHQAASVRAVYHDGGYTYTLQDPSLKEATLTLEVCASPSTEALLLKFDLSSPLEGLQLHWTFGGLDGAKGKRSVDLGTEGMPVSQWWSFSALQCTGNTATVHGKVFTLQGPKGTIHGSATAPHATHRIFDATQWDQGLQALLQTNNTAAAAPTTQPAILGSAPLEAGTPLFLTLEHEAAASAPSTAPSTAPSAKKTPPPALAKPSPSSSLELSPAARFAAARHHFEQLARQVTVDTPDALLNASVAALNIAADGVWDTPTGTVQHGAVAWRSKLLGWRGPYLNDALGWPERARSHIDYWAGQQNQAPLPAHFPPASAKDNLSRNEPALHSNGDLSGSHYDMNLVYVDALFRHLLWTGDLALGRRLWPLLKRHLAWEQRLFRRSYGPEALPLYEGYCCIWASDDLWYSGGGATHSTAYNYWHNLMAARLAGALGEDPAPYANEAALIRRALSTELWLAPEGRYAEAREWLGAKAPRTHPALWSFYHAVDSEAATPLEAYQMSRYIDTELAHFPLSVEGLPSGEKPYTLPTTNWHPYAWSTNNVVMSEVTHTALAFWQTGRRDEAWLLYKGALLDSMWTGECPGNAGMCTNFDVYRRESQRDFADSIGMTARALVEGLFGVHPDALAGELLLKPGLPTSWEHAALHHPYLDFEYTRTGLSETWELTPLSAPASASTATPSAPAATPSDLSAASATPTSRPKPTSSTPPSNKPTSSQWRRLRLQLPALTAQVETVLLDGQKCAWTAVVNPVGEPRLEVLIAVPADHDSKPTETGAPAAESNTSAAACSSTASPSALQGRTHRLVLTWKDAPLAHRPQVATLKQSASPLSFDFSPAKITRLEDPQNALLQVRLTPSTLHALPAPVPPRVTAYSDSPMAHRTAFVHLTQGDFSWIAPLAFSVPTPDQTQAPYDWDAPLPPAAQLESVSLEKHYNRRLTTLLDEELLSPRSPFVSLAIPRHGFGSWCNPSKTFKIDDRALRALTSNPDPLAHLFKTPTDASQPNAAVTSLWSQHPSSLTLPLQGKASRLFLLLTGTSTSMSSRVDTGVVQLNYTDGSSSVLPLRNPDNWWPIDQDLTTDDFAFSRPRTTLTRFDLATGRFRRPSQIPALGKTIPGGAASLLTLPLDPDKELKSLEIRPIANEILLGLLAATLQR